MCGAHRNVKKDILGPQHMLRLNTLKEVFQNRKTCSQCSRHILGPWTPYMYQNGMII